jgi:hypothetical protein
MMDMAQKRKRMTNEIEIAKLEQVIYDPETGELYLKMKVVDPTMKQLILKNSWENNIDAKLVVEKKGE